MKNVKKKRKQKKNNDKNCLKIGKYNKNTHRKSNEIDRNMQKALGN